MQNTTPLLTQPENRFIIHTMLAPDRGIPSERVATHISNGTIFWEDITPATWSPFVNGEKEISGFDYLARIHENRRLGIIMNASVLEHLCKHKNLIPESFRDLSNQKKVHGISICFFNTIFCDQRGKYIRYLWISNYRTSFVLSLCRYLADPFSVDYVTAIIPR